MEIKSCDIGLVFALGVESGSTEDLLAGAIRIRGSGLVIKEGGIKGRRVVIIRSGASQKNAARATELLIDGHNPKIIISAGFAGGLSPALKRHDFLLADSVIGGPDFNSTLPIPNPQSLIPGYPSNQPNIHVGKLLTLDRIVREPCEKHLLNLQHQALAVDMETYSVAQVCLRRSVPFYSIRIIHDAADDILPPDVEKLLHQKTEAARLGAAFAAICRRPGSIKDLWELKEISLVASQKLAEFIVKLATLS